MVSIALRTSVLTNFHIHTWNHLAFLYVNVTYCGMSLYKWDIDWNTCVRSSETTQENLAPESVLD